MATLKELRSERLRKLEDIKKLGLNPYPANATRTNELGDILNRFDELEGSSVTVAGRILNIRKFGKIAFVVLKDQTGRLQLFVTEEHLGKLDVSKNSLGISELSLLDSGDFIEATGQVIKTQTGEISVQANEIRLLTKSLRPMPLSQEGFTNKEERLRRRYVDMNVNEDVRQRFVRRSKFWQATRDFLNKNSFNDKSRTATKKADWCRL
jgi:lysyl-tRNA synthetase class 2